MQISLYFEKYSDVYRFIQVNNTCKEAIERLKINPWFTTGQSAIKFCQHFEPETLNCSANTFFNKEIFNKVSNIRNPCFNGLIKVYESDIIVILPKIYHIGLYFVEEEPEENEKKEIDETTSFFIQHAKEFNNLRKVTGDIQLVVEFFKCFTENGNQMYVHFPYRIETFDGEDLNTQQELVLLNQLKSFIPKNDNIQISFTANQHVKTKEELKFYDRILYHYDSFSDGQCELQSDAIECEEGRIDIKRTLDCNCFNRIIEKCYAKQIVVVFKDSFTEETGPIFAAKKHDKWVVPECVRVIEFSIIFEYESSYILPVIMDNIKFLTLTCCGNIEINGDFPQLKVISIIECYEITINCLENTKKVKKIEIENCDDCDIAIRSSSVQEILFESVYNVLLNTDMSAVTDFIVMRSTECIFNSFSFEKVFVQMENCCDIDFYEIDSFGPDDEVANECLMSPLNYCDVNYNKFQEIIANVLYLPSSQLFNKMDIKDYKNLFQIRWFYVSCTRLRCRGETIELINNKKVDSTLINCLFSSDFYREENQNLDMYLTQNNNELTKVKSTIRYFEITMDKPGLISIGLVNSDLFELNIYEFVGNTPESIGYIGENGNIYNGNHNEIFSFKPYGTNEDKKEVVGCGFNTKTKEVFFTNNGIKGFSKQLKWGKIEAVISISSFQGLHINYGQEPFLFDVFNEIEECDSKCIIA